MNIFITHKDNILLSIREIDDLRLNKQLLENKTILDYAIDKSSAYSSHPILKYYKQYPQFVLYFSMLCLSEYYARSGKVHTLWDYFMDIFLECENFEKYSNFIPYYVEGGKDKSDSIRTIENTDILFQNKLIKKWENDKRQPKWTNREIPKFYKDWLEQNKSNWIWKK